MKYSKSNKPIVCMMTQSTCYKGTEEMKPVGVLWHSTGANNPSIARYVQPDDNASDREKTLALLGKNRYNNDWNHIYKKAGLNAWVGKLADGTVASVQTMPWNFSPWGCGSYYKNGPTCNNGWIQFEICEDNLKNKDYFDKVYQEACELTAYLCDMYDIDPMGKVKYAGIDVPTILCHQDSYRLKLGSNHGDIYHWFSKYGKTMQDVREDVAKLVGKTTTVDIEEGDIVKLADNAIYYNGGKVPSWVRNKTWVVKEVSGNRVVIDKSADGKVSISSPVDAKYLTVIKEDKDFKSYLVKVNVGKLNYRSGPSTKYKINGSLKKGDVFTIVEENGSWGKLKSGAGWIYLPYTKKI